MGNLTKKTITRGAVVALALSAGAATTANAAVTRTAGADRYSTATEIFKAWPTTTDTAVLAAGMGHDVDALTVAPLAKAKNAPVILVDTKATTAAIVAQFSAFKTVYIANGTGVISADVETALTAAGKTVVRLGGATRTATALNIAKAIGSANGIVVANGDDAHLVDTLSIASIAAAKGMPIFLTSGGSLSADEATYAKGLGATNVYALGGTAVVPDAAVAGLGTATRLAGAGRYETNAAVVNAFKADLDLTNIYVASGEDANLIDALAGAPLAGLKKAPIVFAHNSLNADVNTLLTNVVTKDTNVVVLGGTGAVSADAAGAIMNIQVPGSYTPVGTGSLAVSAVTVASATSLKVTFNQAPADTSAVKFAVQAGSATVDVTPTWNAAKTEATLTSASNLAEGSYTVNVKNGTTDLGTSTVAVSQQKIAKISITSTKLGVANVKAGDSTTFGGLGYATYKVFDQFGNDITMDPLANSLTFQSGVGSVTGKNGVITVTPTVNLITFTSGVVITGYDSSSGVSTSATLTVSSQLGTLSDINISALTNADKKVLTAQDTATLFYVTYTATDISGNPTTDYDTVKNGLILDSNDCLTGTSSYITAKVVADPSDSKKAAIQVQVNSATDSISADMPIVITAMTYTGKTSTLNVTLKKAADIDKIVLMAPAYNIAVGENKEIPFTAYDQNGAVLTKYSDIVKSGVSVSGAYWYQNVDGTASLKAGAAKDTTSKTSDGDGFANDGTQMVTATTPTGKYSSISINVQKRVVADSLTLDPTVFKTIFQQAQGGNMATQNIDFGYDAGGMTIKDQYGRVIDMTSSTAAGTGNDRYYVTATSSAIGVISTTTNQSRTGDGQHIVLSANGVGTATVTFNLYSDDPKKADGTDRDITKAIDTKTQTFTVIKNDDIKDYTIDAVANPIYIDNAIATTNRAGVTDRANDYKANPSVYGLTSTGAKVVLAGYPILGMNVDSSDFAVYADDAGDGAGHYGPGKTDVVANKLADQTKTGSSTNLSVNILGADGDIHSVTTAIKSSTADPVAKSVALSTSTKIAGISVSGDVVTLTTGSGITYNSLLGGKTGHGATVYGSLAKYNAAGWQVGSQNVYIAANDQYGQNSMALTQFLVVGSKTSLAAGHAFTIDTDGTILLNTATKGDYVTVSGVTSNGLVKTIQIVFN